MLKLLSQLILPGLDFLEFLVHVSPGSWCKITFDLVHHHMQILPQTGHKRNLHTFNLGLVCIFYLDHLRAELFLQIMDYIWFHFINLWLNAFFNFAFDLIYFCFKWCLYFMNCLISLFLFFFDIFQNCLKISMRSLQLLLKCFEIACYLKLVLNLILQIV